MLISRILRKQRPASHTEETAMHPTISYYLAQARIADLHQHAQQDTLARAASRTGVAKSTRTSRAEASRPGLRWGC
jgi:hypothetical protein